MERPNLFSLKPYDDGFPDQHITNKSAVKYSGNSDVDVNVHVDTKPIAYAMLCTLLASKQISNEEFEEAVSRLDKLTNREKRKMKNVDDFIRPKLNKR